MIEISGLRRHFLLGDELVEALRGVDIRIERGEYVAIVGPSGSGKSTLMNLLGCLDTPTEGRYLLDGVEVQVLDDDALAEIRNRKDRFCLSKLQPAAAGKCRRQCGAADAVRGSKAGRHDGKLRSRRCVASDWATGCTTGPISSRVDSDSGWRLPVRSSTIRRCFWRTSRREILISGPGRKSSHCLKDCTKKA